MNVHILLDNYIFIAIDGQIRCTIANLVTYINMFKKFRTKLLKIDT